VAAHPGADDRHLADLLLGLDPGAHPVEAGDHVARRGEVVTLDREREVRQIVLGDRFVLDDHVDVHVRVGQGAEDPPGDPGLIAYPGQGDSRLPVGVGYGCDHWAFHRLVFG